MNTKPSTVKALAQLMQETGLTSLEIRENDCIIKLERGGTVQAALPVQQPVPSVPASGAQTAPAAQEDDPGMDFNHAKLVTSPMVGVFYAAPSPDRAPFVTIGSHVHEGDTHLQYCIAI